MSTTTAKGLTGNSEAARLRRWALDALRRHEGEGTLPTSNRHLFYEAVLAGVTGKETTGARRADQNLSEATTWLREHGYVAWSAIEDRTRHLQANPGWTTVHAGVADLVDAVRLSPWDDGPQPVLVVESESVAGVLEQTAYTYRVPVVPTRGQANGWLRTSVADALDHHEKIVVGYVGDHDFSGAAIEANTERVLDEVLSVVSWDRLALTAEQVTDHGLPVIDRYDGRTKTHHPAVEVEALPQRVLVAAVVEWLEDLLPEPLEDVHVREADEQTAVLALLRPAT